MPAKDLFHEAVKSALQKSGWIITHDPFPIPYSGVDLYIDLGAEKLLAAERNNEQIAVEIKSFLAPSLVSAFHTAVGQFLNYQLVLETQNSDRRLFLAVPIDTYKIFLSLPFPQLVIQRYQIGLIVYDPQEKEIVSWIK